MITRLYVDNYKTLVNFQWRPQSVELLAGRNGSGKSSVFEIMEKLNALLVQGKKVADLFSPSEFTRWTTKPSISIELEILNGTMRFHYRLSLGRDPDRGFVLIEAESLDSEGQRILSYADRHLTLTAPSGGSFGSFDFGSSRSFVAEIQKNPNTEHHLAFRDAMKRVGVFAPNPLVIRARSESVASDLLGDCKNLVDWYRYWIAPEPERIVPINNLFRTSLPGFQRLALQQVGDAWEMRVEFRFATGSAEFRLEDLSDGQRMIVALTLIIVSRRFWILLLDEPDNFVAPTEIHKVLSAFDDSLTGNQLAVISHHPETIDYFASHSATLFRLEEGMTRCESLHNIDLEGEKLSTALIDGIV